MPDRLSRTPNGPAEPDVIAVVCPVLDDWESFAKLVGELDLAGAGTPYRLHILAVDDGSIAGPDTAFWRETSFSSIAQVEVIHLATNLGHQRAIAVGLVAAARLEALKAVIVMDADGEDKPADILRLLEAHQTEPSHLILAQRAQRKESLLFRLGYVGYKLLFRLMTGRHIGFGNFCLIPAGRLTQIIYKSDLWNHLAASISRGRLPVRRVKLGRGPRYFGQSKMGYLSLVTFGLSAISVFIDLVIARVLVAGGLMAALCTLAIGAVLWVKIFTAMAIPGWATNALGFAIVLLLQTLALSVVSVLLALYGRSTRGVIPAIDAEPYIHGREILYPHDPA
jgi:hypothetical protein